MLNTAVPDVSVCSSEERSTFNKNLVRILKTEYNRVQSAAATGKQCVVKTRYNRVQSAAIAGKDWVVKTGYNRVQSAAATGKH